MADVMCPCCKFETVYEVDFDRSVASCTGCKHEQDAKALVKEHLAATLDDVVKWADISMAQTKELLEKEGTEDDV